MKIRPEELAGKIRAFRNGDLHFLRTEWNHPRFFECLHFIQDASHRPAGLRGLADSLIETSPSSFGGKEELPIFLLDLCIDERTDFCPPACRDFFWVLLRFIDRRAEEISKQLANTECKRIIFRELDFSKSQKVPKVLIGNSRIGKTKASSVWADMFPGQRRLVTVPESNAFRDFIVAHADALHLEHTPRMSTRRISEAVEYVISQGDLFFVYDEAQGLIPASYTKTTAPKRLNWVRFHMIDKEIGCAFFATPQSYQQTLENYTKVTKYSMEQWLGRLPPATILPVEMRRGDLMAVAKKHFPEIHETLMELICSRAMQSEGWLKNIELTAKRARFIAAERGHRAPQSRDVEEAIVDMMQPQGEGAAWAPPMQRAGAANSAQNKEFTSRGRAQTAEDRQAALLVDA